MRRVNAAKVLALVTLSEVSYLGIRDPDCLEIKSNYKDLLEACLVPPGMCHRGFFASPARTARRWR